MEQVKWAVSVAVLESGRNGEKTGKKSVYPGTGINKGFSDIKQPENRRKNGQNGEKTGKKSVYLGGKNHQGKKRRKYAGLREFQTLR